MKEITKMSRLTGQLEKAFRMLNEAFFDGALPTPMITVIPSARSYAHYTVSPVWSAKGEARHEINIASGTLDRPIESVLASLLHEMVHSYNNEVLNVQDTSNRGVYHNKIFKREAEAHGLIVSRSERYGWSHTEPGDALLEFVIEHEDSLREIEMCRADTSMTFTTIGGHTGSSTGTKPVTPPSHHRKYYCPSCGNSCRATKMINLICGDCLCPMLEA